MSTSLTAVEMDASRSMVAMILAHRTGDHAGFAGLATLIDLDDVTPWFDALVSIVDVMCDALDVCSEVSGASSLVLLRDLQMVMAASAD